ncbi:hypothetical protein GK047_12320 [Paenibacillus sp. SYP-B3998]|uniref:Calx-beta domain-containing protein n=1 Tax=Paenibacillus sp. SYP-B3998 TaxID=2678564 RepID=A0A6G3ZZG6_9BACL|nr:Calx-beta domain-containing protein [Paenibacillus sp. SYP-B3998]NEW06797.1 hypothetical protein [Paenibacillus sp. SYP-B3998]
MKGFYLRWLFAMILPMLVLALSPVGSNAQDGGIRIEKQTPGVVDAPPTIAIQKPEILSITTKDVDVKMTCMDDDPAGCKNVTLEADGKQILSSVDGLDTVISLAEYEGRGVTLKFTGYDSAGQRTEAVRYVNVDSGNRRLSLVNSFPNARSLDLDSARVLLLHENNFEIRDLHSGQVIASIPNSLDAAIKEAYLTPKGAMIRTNATIYEWREDRLSFVLDTYAYATFDSLIKIKGNYALIKKNYCGVLRNLLTGADTIIAPSCSIEGLLEDGTAIYSSGNEDGVFRQYKEGIGSSVFFVAPPGYVMIGTDEVSTLLMKFGSEDKFPLKYTLLLHTSSGNRELGPFVIGYLPEHAYKLDIMQNNGWIAHFQFGHSEKEEEGILGPLELWVISPDGTEQQVADEDYYDRLESISENGDVLFKTEGSYDTFYVSDNVAGQRDGFIRIPVGITNPVWRGDQLYGIMSFDNQITQVYRINTDSNPEQPDTTAPVISKVKPADGVTITTATPTLSAKLTDKHSGINADSIRLKLDGEVLQAHYEITTMTVTASAYGLSNGIHHLEIIVADRAGNTALSTTSFQKKDLEPTGKLQFTTLATMVDERAGTVTATVYRSGGSSGGLTVNYRTWNRSASAGSDYIFSSGQLTFANGEMKKSIQVKIVNDTYKEQLEVFYLSLYAPSEEGALGANTETTFIIRDDD